MNDSPDAEQPLPHAAPGLLQARCAALLAASAETRARATIARIRARARVRDAVRATLRALKGGC